MTTEPATSCVFCKIARREITPDVLAFHDEHTAVFPSLHQQPRNRGHLLVVPVRHVAQIYTLEADLAGPLMASIARAAAAVKSAFGAHGVSVRQNNERYGGQDVFHVHFHVIPRFFGDEFDSGDDRFPYGTVEIPLTERIQQAANVSAVLSRTRASSVDEAG